MKRCDLCLGSRKVSAPGSCEYLPCPCEPPPHDPYAALTDDELTEKAGGVLEVVGRIVGPVPALLREWGREVARRRAGDDLGGLR